MDKQFTSDTYRYHPAADVFVEDDFGPDEDKHTAVPEGLGLGKQIHTSALGLDL